MRAFIASIDWFLAVIFGAVAALLIVAIINLPTDPYQWIPAIASSAEAYASANPLKAIFLVFVGSLGTVSAYGLWQSIPTWGQVRYLGIPRTGYKIIKSFFQIAGLIVLPYAILSIHGEFAFFWDLVATVFVLLTLGAFAIWLISVRDKFKLEGFYNRIAMPIVTVVTPGVDFGVKWFGLIPVRQTPRFLETMLPSLFEWFAEITPKAL